MPDAMLAAIASACAVASRIEAEQLRRRRHRAERADGARRVEALLVVMRMDRLGDLALDLEAGEKRLEELRARDALPFAEGQRRRQRRHRRMRQQAEDAIGARRQLRVVEVQRVAAGAVQERRRRRAGAERLRRRTPSPRRVLVAARACSRAESRWPRSSTRRA